MEDKVTVSQIGLKYGIIIGLILIIYSMILEFLGLEWKTQQTLGYITYVILIIGIVLAHKAFKEGGDGFMSVGQGLGVGTLLSLIAGVLSSIFSFIYIKFIDDSMLEKIKDAQIEQMENQGMDDAQIEQAMEIAGKFTTPVAILIMGIVGMVFIGFILSLIVSLFTKKSNPALDV